MSYIFLECSESLQEQKKKIFHSSYNFTLTTPTPIKESASLGPVSFSL